MAVISANFESRKIVSCIYHGDPNGAAPLKGPFKAEIIQFPSASPRQPFASSAELLFALGYGPMPENAKKIPCFKGWPNYYPGKPKLPDEIRELIAKHPNVRLGVVCGYNRLLSVDIDTDDQDKINAILHALPTWTAAKRGNKGLTIFFRYAGDLEKICNRSFYLKGADGKKGAAFCEILWHGRKTTVPPTPHAKTGNPYTWVNGEHTLFNTPVEKLPEITAAHLEALEAAIKPWTYQPPPRPESGLGRPLARRPAGHEEKRFRAYAQTVLDGRAKDLSGAGEGGRNRMLFDAVCVLGKYVHHGYLDRADMVNALAASCNHNGLEKSDGGTRGIMETIKSGLWTSRNDPLRELPDRPRRNGSHAPQDKPQTAEDRNGATGGNGAATGANGPQPEASEGEAKVHEAAARLAALSTTQYQLKRTAEAKDLGVTLKHLDGLVKEAGKASAPPKERPESKGMSMSDFYAVLPMHQYLYVPTRALWPAVTINSLFGVPDPTGQEPPPSQILDQTRGVQALTWAPGEPLLIENRLVCEAGWIDRQDCRTLNLYRPPDIGDHGDPNDVDPWLDHIRKIYPDGHKHLIDWLAHRVQRPQEKINHALVLAGPPGIGKDTILEPLKHAVGPWNLAEVSPRQLTGRFNGFLKSVILRVSEARDLGDLDRYAFYETTKTMWAAPPDMLRVDEKNIKEHPVVNVLGGIITTNHRTDGFYLPPDDRRHFVLWSNATKDDFTEKYWIDLWRWYGEGGFENVAAFLQARNLSGFDPKKPPEKTPAFWAIVDNSRAPEEAELYDELEKLNWPKAVTLEQVINAATDTIGGWLSDRKNRRSIPYKFECCDYIPFRNSGTKDGRWKVGGKNRVIYVRMGLSGQEQHKAVAELIKAAEARW